MDCTNRLYQSKPATPDTRRINAILKTLLSGIAIDHDDAVMRFQWTQGGDSDSVRTTISRRDSVGETGLTLGATPRHALTAMKTPAITSTTKIA